MWGCLWVPKKAAELSALAVKRLTEPGRYAVGGVSGLHLQISKKRATSWILRVKVGDRRRDIGLGAYPDVPLASARDRARESLAQIRRGIDPVLERHAARARLRAEQAATLTFDEAARRFLAVKTVEFRNPKHRAQWATTLETYASPILGRMPVSAIDLPAVVAVLQPIWTSKTETASRLRGRIESVLAWATVHGYRAGDNPARWRGHLDAVLPKPGKVAKAGHHAALPIDKLPSFMRKLAASSGMGARALEFAIFTAARSGEVRGATWAEIDITGKVWTVPADRMKAGREHRSPLSPPALKVLRALSKGEPDELVFQGLNGEALSDRTLIAVCRRMKVDATPHGFRSTFRDWAAERTDFPPMVAEMALAHTVSDKTEAAYRRGDLFEKRRQLMAAWARYCRPSLRARSK